MLNLVEMRGPPAYGLLREPAADHSLGHAVAVERGGVDPVDAGGKCAVEYRLALSLGAPNEKTADPSAAERQGRNLEAGAAEASPLHVCCGLDRRRRSVGIGARLAPLARPDDQYDPSDDGD